MNFKKFEEWKTGKEFLNLSESELRRIFLIEESNRVLNEEMEEYFKIKRILAGGSNISLVMRTFDFTFDITFK